MFEIKKTKDLEFAYLILRLTMGLNMLVHGLVRFPKLKEFSSGLVKMFTDSPLPDFSIVAFSYSLPFVEFFVGLFLILGFKTEKAINLGSLVIMSLVFGSCLIEKWDMAGGQMLYALFFFALSIFTPLNTHSLDYRFSNSKV